MRCDTSAGRSRFATQLAQPDPQWTATYRHVRWGSPGGLQRTCPSSCATGLPLAYRPGAHSDRGAPPCCARGSAAPGSWPWPQHTPGLCFFHNQALAGSARSGQEAFQPEITVKLCACCKSRGCVGGWEAPCRKGTAAARAVMTCRWTTLRHARARRQHPLASRGRDRPLYGEHDLNTTEAHLASAGRWSARGPRQRCWTRRTRCPASSAAPLPGQPYQARPMLPCPARGHGARPAARAVAGHLGRPSFASWHDGQRANLQLHLAARLKPATRCELKCAHARRMSSFSQCCAPVPCPMRSVAVPRSLTAMFD